MTAKSNKASVKKIANKAPKKPLQDVFLLPYEWVTRFGVLVNPEPREDDPVFGSAENTFSPDSPYVKAARDGELSLNIWSWVQDDDHDADYLVAEDVPDAIGYALTLLKPEEHEVVHVFFDNEELEAFKQELELEEEAA